MEEFTNVITNQEKNMNQENARPIVIGLDIGTTKVVAVAGRKTEFNKLEIVGFGQTPSLGVSHGVVQNISQCIDSINQAIENCMASNPELQMKEVYVGIAGQHIKSLQTRGDRVRNLTEDEITQEEIDMLIRDQRKTYIPAGDEIIDIIPQDFVVDNATNVLNPVGMSGVKIGANFHIITGDKHAIRNIKRCVEKANLSAQDLVLQPLASAAAIITEEDLEAGVCIVDIGGGTTDMAVFADNMLKHTAVIPFAGTNITEDIRKGLGVLRAQAEEMKNKYGTALAEEASSNAYITIPGLRGMQAKEISVKNLASIIQARMREILEHVFYHLKQLDLDKKLYGGIILTGGGSQLKHVVQLAEFVTGMNVRIGYPTEHLSGGEFAEQLSHPKYATVIGLILRGFVDLEKEQRKAYASMRFSATPKQQKEEEQLLPQQAVDEELDVVDDGGEIKSKPAAPNRSSVLERIFDRLKEGFIKMFEEPEDEELN